MRCGVAAGDGRSRPRPPRPAGGLRGGLESQSKYTDNVWRNVPGDACGRKVDIKEGVII